MRDTVAGDSGFRRRCAAFWAAGARGAQQQRIGVARAQSRYRLATTKKQWWQYKILLAVQPLGQRDKGEEEKGRDGQRQAHGKKAGAAVAGSVDWTIACAHERSRPRLVTSVRRTRTWPCLPCNCILSLSLPAQVRVSRGSQLARPLPWQGGARRAFAPATPRRNN